MITHLLANPAYAVAVSVRPGVQLVHHGRLSTSGIIIVGASGAGGTGGTSGSLRRVASKSTANSSWFTLKPIIALLTALQAATLLLEIRHTDSRKCRGSMVLRLVLMDFVNRDRGVDNGWLNGLLLDNWLNSLR